MIDGPFSTDLGELSVTGEHRTIPFDYAFRYELGGAVGKVHNQTVTVSIESSFVAVSIGYGVISKITPIVFGPDPPPPSSSSIPISLAAGIPGRINPKLVDLDRIDRGLNRALNQTAIRQKGNDVIGFALKLGIKLNPESADVILSSLSGGANIDDSLAEKMFQVVAPPPDQIQFLYALFDEGSGREFQSDPILNTAGLGTSDGDRPFRYFARPITFRPRSVIRMQITEVSDFIGDLHVSLQGYKVLGDLGTPTGRVQRGVRRGRAR